MRKKRTARPPIQPGVVVGGFRVVSHYQDELFNCVCVEAGHEEVRSRATLLSPTSVCKRCRRLKAYGEYIGKTFGSVTITELIVQPSKRRGRESETECLYVYRCACGREGSFPVRSIIDGDVTGRNCDGCRKKKIEAAKVLNQDWKPTVEEAKELDAAILRGVRSVLTAKEVEQIGDDCVSTAWIELLQYPELRTLTTKQLAGTANRLGRRVAISSIQERNEYLREQARPAQDDDGEGDFLDIFDTTIIEPSAPSEGYELQMAALDILNPDDREFMLCFVQTRGVKSKGQKKRYAELVDKVRAAHADILVAINEEGAANAIAA